MNNNNPAPFSGIPEQWLSNIYVQEFAGLKMYAVRIVHNEVEADDIVGQCFQILARELCNSPGKFSSPAKAKAYLVTIVKNKCRSWLRKKRAVMVCEPAEAIEAIMDDHSLLLELERRDQLQHLLPHIDQLPGKLQQVAMLYLKEGLTCKEVEKRLHLKKNVLRVYRNRVVSKLREIIQGGKNNAINYEGALNIQDERSSAQPVGNLL